MDMLITTFVIDPAEESEADDRYRVETLDGAPAISAKNMSDVVDAVLTADELEAGYSLLLVSLPFDDGDVPKADKAALEAKAKDLGSTLGAWFDISLYKVKDDEQVKLAEVSTPVSITMKMPKSLRKDGRTFYVLRYHDGKVSVVAKGEGASFSWESDKFSTYAISYKDAEEAVPVDADKPEPTKSSASSSSSAKSTTGTQASKSSSSTAAAKKGGSVSTIARTGDPFQLAVVAIGLTALVAGAAAMLALWRRNQSR